MTWTPRSRTCSAQIQRRPSLQCVLPLGIRRPRCAVYKRTGSHSFHPCEHASMYSLMLSVIQYTHAFVRVDCWTSHISSAHAADSGHRHALDILLPRVTSWMMVTVT